MSQTPYVVPDHGFGAAHSLRVHDMDPDAFARLLGSADVRTVSVILGAPAADADARVGLTVRHDGATIGALSASATAEYTELDWILEAGLSPAVSARLTLYDDGYPLAMVVLPAPGLCVPANNPPAIRWAMLDGGPGIPVQGMPASLASYPREPKHFLVTLRARRFLGHRSVSAYIDGTFVGSLPHDDALQLADVVINYDHSGLLSVARGYYKYNEGRPSLTIYADADRQSRKPFAVVAGTAATTGMVASAAAVARANAAVPMTGFFTGEAVASAGAAGATAAGVAAAGGTTTTASASSATSAGAGAGVSLPAVAAASTAVLTLGGLGVATHHVLTEPADVSSATAAPAPAAPSSDEGDAHANTTTAATPRVTEQDAAPTSRAHAFVSQLQQLIDGGGRVVAAAVPASVTTTASPAAPTTARAKRAATARATHAEPTTDTSSQTTTTTTHQDSPESRMEVETEPTPTSTMADTDDSFEFAGDDTQPSEPAETTSETSSRPAPTPADESGAVYVDDPNDRCYFWFGCVFDPTITTTTTQPLESTSTAEPTESATS